MTNLDGGPVRWARLILAWGITFGLLAYLFGVVSIFALLGGGLDVRLALVVAMLIGYVLTLSWGLKPPGKAWGTLAVWVAVFGGLVAAFAAPTMPLPLLLLAFVPSSIWVVWLAWFGAWPLSWRDRWRWLGVWLAVGAVGPALLRVEGMTGDVHLNFVWRFSRVVPAAPQASAAGATIDVSPTPDDFPQFLGPTRTGVVAGKVGKLVERWRRPVGAGWGSFAVIGGYAFTQEQLGESECVTCYRVADGEPQWTHSDEARFAGIGGVGPCATPTVVDGRVYSVGGTGLLNCLDAGSGRRLWQVDLLAEFAAANLTHGVGASPLVDGDRVIVCPTARGGPSLAAFHRDDGRRLWQAGTQSASYSSPTLAEIAGTPQILLFGADGVSGQARDDGRELWHFEWHPPEGINATQPLVGVTGPDRVFVSTGYGRGAALFCVNHDGSEWKTESLWTSQHLKTKFATAVAHGGFVYGLDDGVLACIDPATGQRKWKDGRYGHGQLLLAGDTLIVQAEKGEIVLVAPSPDGLRERGRTPALSAKTWNNPTLACRHLLVRNDREMVCFAAD